MTYPILEHDPTREAFIEPARVIKKRDMPQHCVISFFSEVIDKASPGWLIWLEKDTDLDPIRDKRGFKEIVAKAQNKQ